MSCDCPTEILRWLSRWMARFSHLDLDADGIGLIQLQRYRWTTIWPLWKVWSYPVGQPSTILKFGVRPGSCWLAILSLDKSARVLPTRPREPHSSFTRTFTTPNRLAISSTGSTSRTDTLLVCDWFLILSTGGRHVLILVSFHSSIPPTRENASIKRGSCRKARKFRAPQTATWDRMTLWSLPSGFVLVHEVGTPLL